MGLTLLLPVVVILLLLLRLLYPRPHLPPGPRPWPVVGNLYQIKSVRFRCFAEWAQSYGPIISVWEGSTLNVVVSSSKLAREVLNEKDRHLANCYRSRAVSKLTGHGGGLIWADYNPRYVKLRKVCTTALLSAKSLESLRRMREDEVTAMVESIYTECRSRGRRSVLLEKYVKVVGFNNITRMVFGKRRLESEGEEMKAIAAERERKLLGEDSCPIAEHVPWLRWMFPLDDRSFAEHAARKDRLMRRIINDRTSRSLQTDGAKHVLFNTLITVIDMYGLTGFTGTGLLWDIIHAGMDTTAISVEWAMAELIKNPLVQHKAQEELDRVIGHDHVMTEQDIPNLPYLRCIVKESLRLHPPTPLMLPHRASVDVTIGGYHVPKGTTVLVNVWAVARDRLVWENPLDFHPERFLEDDVDIRGHNFRLLPFGAGRRMCPGAQLSIDLVTSIIGHLLHHFSWSPPDGVRPEEVDIRETASPGLVSSIETPLEAVPTPRLATNLYKRMAVNI